MLFSEQVRPRFSTNPGPLSSSDVRGPAYAQNISTCPPSLLVHPPPSHHVPGCRVLKATVKGHRSHTATRQEPKGCPSQLQTQGQREERPRPRSAWFLGVSQGLGLLLLLCHPLQYRSVTHRTVSVLCPLNSPAAPPPPQSWRIVIRDLTQGNQNEQAGQTE